MIYNTPTGKMVLPNNSSDLHKLVRDLAKCPREGKVEYVVDGIKYTLTPKKQINIY